MKTLFIIPREKDVALGEGHFRTENTIKALEHLTDLHILSLAPRKIIRDEKQQGRTFAFYKKFLLNDAKFIVHYAKKQDINVIWFHDGHLCYALIKQVRALVKDLRLIAEITSVPSRKMFRELPFKVGKGKDKKIISQLIKKEEEEKSFVTLCDVVTASSEFEVNYYRNLTQQREKIALFSQVVDIQNYSKGAIQSLKKPALYIVGSYGPGIEGMSWSTKWLFEEVLPLVKKKLFPFHCYIACQSDNTTETEYITFIGKEDSALTYLQNSDVALIPLQFVPGNALNLLQAAGCNIPIVSTTLGALGPPVEANQHIMIADTAEEFTNAIIKLIEDKPFARYIAEKCYQLVNQQFGLERLKNEAKEILSRMTI